MSGLDPRLAHTRFTVACDVDNPPVRREGGLGYLRAAEGRAPEMVAQLDAALRRFGTTLEAVTGKRIISAPGAGAAGGMGAALLGMLNAQLRPGIDIVMQTLGLAQAVRDADLVITGEGRLDSQSIHGKTPVGVARVAKQFQRPVVAIAGSLTPDYQVVHEHGIDAAFSVLDRIVTLEEALDDAARNLRVTARNVAALWRMAQNHR
uniref:glycerate kinase n=1 Tax=Cronobacter dublinensis TaxID=413497 RepID=UPI000CFB3915|nr:glycerate kinase [Cronobacter dublinensis]